MKHVITVFFLLAYSWIYSQSDSITVLEKVIVSDAKLKKFSTGQTLEQLSDSVLLRNNPSLTSVLTYNSPVYFKENGLGMVSSPSFRGTTAQQTAVLWNGININSQFNGQTDFNTINAGNYDNISVRAGGGSILYGTGAIGGTIHLNSELTFEPEFKNRLHTSYGSFSTLDLRYKLKAASKRWSTNFSIVRNSSANDYPYPIPGEKNKNGKFYNTGINTAIGYRLAKQHTLTLYSQFTEGERHFPIQRRSENKTKYQDINTRNLLTWKAVFSKFTSITSVAFLKENYKYYGNIKRESYTYGEAKTVLGKYDMLYQLNRNISLNAVFSLNNTTGKGSNIKRHSRAITAGALLMKHQLSKKLSYELAFRKESTEEYKSPFLYSAGVDYEVSKNYLLKLNVSRNFRIPTFNDLYWYNSGNTELNAEKSIQAELGNTFHFNQLEVSFTGYYIKISDMIHWIPTSSGLWKPQNEANVATYGGEFLSRWQKTTAVGNIGMHVTYAYTISKNENTQKQLIYVPYHKATGAIDYRFDRISVSFQQLYVGKVFTRSDNNPVYTVSKYWISNAQVGYYFDKKKQSQLGFCVQNIFDEAYQAVENRFMPGINYAIYLTLNI